MLRRKAIVGFVVLSLAVVAGYRYWVAGFDFDSSGLRSGDGKALLTEVFGLGLPAEIITVREKIESGFGNDYSVNALYIIPDKPSSTTAPDCQKYGLMKGGTVEEVLADERMNITQFDKNLVFREMGTQASTCYRRKLAVHDGEIRISLIVISGRYILFIDTHT